MLKLQITNYKLQKKFFLLTTYYLLLTTLTGCAAITEGVKGLAGISTKSLEKARKDAIIKTFSYDYFSCYTKALDSLKIIQAHIYTQDIKKHMIAIYVSEQDTTPVGLFFKELDASHTQLEVSSPSTYAKELIANRVFPILEEQIKSQQK